uniref:Tankyrase 1-binding protein C-terminal domain-containing protein n=1 Tax=Erpetoichthys calabaricus TaxID=27687 RepID=A0A8C4TG32_ERPCA
MATKVDKSASPGVAALTDPWDNEAKVQRGPVSPLTDSSNKSSEPTPALILQEEGGKMLSGSKDKPTPAPKPRLTPKPFTAEKPLGMRPILAAKPLGDGSKIEYSKNSSFGSKHFLEQDSPCSDVLQEESQKVTIRESGGIPLAQALDIKTHKSRDYLSCRPGNQKENQGEETPSITPLHRTKSIDYLSRQETRETDLFVIPSGEALPHLRSRPRPRPMSTLFASSGSSSLLSSAETLDSIEKPPFRTPRPLSADLTAKFESSILSIPAGSKMPQDEVKENVPTPQKKPLDFNQKVGEEKEKRGWRRSLHSKVSTEELDKVSDYRNVACKQEVKLAQWLTEEKTLKDEKPDIGQRIGEGFQKPLEETEVRSLCAKNKTLGMDIPSPASEMESKMPTYGSSIKRRISLLLDSSSSGCGSSVIERETSLVASASPSENIGVRIRQRIRELNAEPAEIQVDLQKRSLPARQPSSDFTKSMSKSLEREQTASPSEGSITVEDDSRQRWWHQQQVEGDLLARRNEGQLYKGQQTLYREEQGVTEKLTSGRGAQRSSFRRKSAPLSKVSDLQAVSEAKQDNESAGHSPVLKVRASMFDNPVQRHMLLETCMTQGLSDAHERKMDQKQWSSLKHYREANEQNQDNQQKQITVAEEDKHKAVSGTSSAEDAFYPDACRDFCQRHVDAPVKVDHIVDTIQAVTEKAYSELVPVAVEDKAVTLRSRKLMDKNSKTFPDGEFTLHDRQEPKKQIWSKEQHEISEEKKNHKKEILKRSQSAKAVRSFLTSDTGINGAWLEPQTVERLKVKPDVQFIDKASEKVSSPLLNSEEKHKEDILKVKVEPKYLSVGSLKKWRDQVEENDGAPNEVLNISLKTKSDMTKGSSCTKDCLSFTAQLTQNDDGRSPRNEEGTCRVLPNSKTLPEMSLGSRSSSNSIESKPEPDTRSRRFSRKGVKNQNTEDTCLYNEQLSKSRICDTEESAVSKGSSSHDVQDSAALKHARCLESTGGTNLQNIGPYGEGVPSYLKGSRPAELEDKAYPKASRASWLRDAPSFTIERTPEVEDISFSTGSTLPEVENILYSKGSLTPEVESVLYSKGAGTSEVGNMSYSKGTRNKELDNAAYAKSLRTSEIENTYSRRPRILQVKDLFYPKDLSTSQEVDIVYAKGSRNSEVGDVKSSENSKGFVVQDASYSSSPGAQNVETLVCHEMTKTTDVKNLHMKKQEAHSSEDTAILLQGMTSSLEDTISCKQSESDGQDASGPNFKEQMKRRDSEHKVTYFALTGHISDSPAETPTSNFVTPLPSSSDSQALDKTKRFDDLSMRLVERKGSSVSHLYNLKRNPSLDAAFRKNKGHILTDRDSSKGQRSSKNTEEQSKEEMPEAQMRSKTFNVDDFRLDYTNEYDSSHQAQSEALGTKSSSNREGLDSLIQWNTPGGLLERDCKSSILDLDAITVDYKEMSKVADGLSLRPEVRRPRSSPQTDDLETPQGSSFKSSSCAGAIDSVGSEVMQRDSSSQKNRKIPERNKGSFRWRERTNPIIELPTQEPNSSNASIKLITAEVSGAGSVDGGLGNDSGLQMNEGIILHLTPVEGEGANRSRRSKELTHEKHGSERVKSRSFRNSESPSSNSGGSSVAAELQSLQRAEWSVGLDHTKQNTPSENVRSRPRPLRKDFVRGRSSSTSRESTASKASAEVSSMRVRSRSTHRNWSGNSSTEQLRQCISKQGPEHKDTDTLVQETESQYGTWDTGLHSEESLTPVSPTTSSSASTSQQKQVLHNTPSSASSQTDWILDPGKETNIPAPHSPSLDHDLVDGPDPALVLSPGMQADVTELSFPERVVSLLDSSAQKNRAQLSKKRSRRTLPSRSVRRSGVPAGADRLSILPEQGSDNWMFKDSTEEKVTTEKLTDSEDEEQPRQVERSPHSHSQRVPVFPVMDPSSLKVPLRKRPDSDGSSDSPASSHLARSPKSHFSHGARVLPPAGGDVGSAEQSPQWLKELKSKSRLSQYESNS